MNSLPDLVGARRAIGLLFNLVEDQQATVRELQAESQRLRDEITDSVFILSAF